MIESVRTWHLLQSIRRSARQSCRNLPRMQEELLRAAVAHGYQNVPFYRRVWDEAGFEPGSVQGIDDLRRLPIIAGRQVREAVRSGELLARDVDPSQCTLFHSTGTSGVPLAVRRQALERRLWRVAGLRMLLEHGFRWWHATVQFDPPPGPLHILQQLGIVRTTWIPGTLPLHDQLDRLRAARAQAVIGTPTRLRRICGAIEATGGGVHKPRHVFSQGEVLDRETRATVRRVLGADPVSVYGLTELGYVAWQCEDHESFHVNAELFVVEVLRDGRPARPGELGAIVVTNLRGRTMPLLRYDTGDLAIAADGGCPCGRPLPRLASIEGRPQASVLLQDGRVVTTRAIVDHLAGSLRLDEYRLHQETERRFRLEVAPGTFAEGPGGASGGADRCEKARVLAVLRELLGEVDIRIEVATSWASAGAEKTHPVSCALPLRLG